MTPIRYIGKKERKEDNVAHTGTVWNGNGDVQNVPDNAVAKLLVHTDSWELAGDAQKSGDELQQTTSTAKSNEPTEADMKPPMVNLETMDKDALRSYAQQHFGHTFHPKAGEAKMRQDIIGLMNRG